MKARNIINSGFGIIDKIMTHEFYYLLMGFAVPFFIGVITYIDQSAGGTSLLFLIFFLITGALIALPLISSSIYRLDRSLYLNLTKLYELPQYNDDVFNMMCVLPVRRQDIARVAINKMRIFGYSYVIFSITMTYVLESFMDSDINGVVVLYLFSGLLASMILSIVDYFESRIKKVLISVSVVTAIVSIVIAFLFVVDIHFSIDPAVKIFLLALPVVVMEAGIHKTVLNRKNYYSRCGEKLENRGINT